MGIESVPKQMTACQVVEFGKPYVIHNVDSPRTLEPHEILVKVAVASLCHTDFMVLDGVFQGELPCTGSHEGAGTIAAVGSAVQDLKEGDRVMCGIMKDLCGKCADCKGPENYRHYCANLGGIVGVKNHGAFADYVVVDSRTTSKLPDAVSFATAAPLACAGCTIWRGILQSGLKGGQWLALIGSGGGLGHLGIQFAKALGIKTIGIDARDEGLELTKKTGADAVIDARKGKKSIVEEVLRVTDGTGADATVNVSDAKSAAATAAAVTKIHGLVVQIAQPEEVSIPFEEFIFRDIRVQGSLVCSPDEAKEMLRVVADHNITVETNLFYGLQEVPKVLELSHSGKMKGKGVVVVDKEQVEQEKKLGAAL